MEQYTIRRKNGGLTILAEGWNYKKLFITIGENSIQDIVKIERNNIIYISIYYRYYVDAFDYKIYMESVEFKDKELADRFIQDIKDVK